MLFALALIPLSFSWERPLLRWVAFTYDVLLLGVAVAESRFCRLPKGVTIWREFGSRFAMGAETEVRIHIQNATNRALTLVVKDEYPPEMILSGAREGWMTVDAQSTSKLIYGVRPPRRGRFEFGQTAVRFLSRFKLIWCQLNPGEPVSVKVYPNMRRAR
ncbi:MAG TPA: hypothetical protein VJW17_01265, partial [Pyrinomonadaceae bacterium]|nr:hypothetical protein [Pyrinomonadaceae bacterium]